MIRPRPTPTLLQRVADAHTSGQFTSAINLGELIYGAERRRLPDLYRRIAEVVSRLVILPFDEPAARVFGPLKAELHRHGTPLDEADLRIAAIALANDLTLVTGNVRHFTRVPNLAIENWLVEP